MKFIFTCTIIILSMASMRAQIYVKHDATGSNDGTSWTNAFINLQIALDAAPDSSQIWIAAGNYIPEGTTPQTSHFWLLKPLKLYGGFAGNETSLSQRNWEANQTILNGDKNGDDVAGNFSTKRTDNAHHVLIIDAPGGENLIDGLIFQGGSTRTDTYTPDATDDYINRWAGGALYVFKSPVTLRNNVFRQNNGNRGSGIVVYGNSPENLAIVVENSLFEKNNAIIRGAGIYIFKAQSSFIRQCQFYENKAVEGAGIAIGNSNGNISDCDFNLNTATYGAGVILFQNTLSNLNYVNFNVSNSNFTDNTALESGGGLQLIALEKGFSLTIDSCLFEKNKCTNIYGDGAAISITDKADLYSSELATEVNISNSVIRDGQAGFSGGILISPEDDSMNVYMNNVKIINNKGFRTGGGLYFGVADLARLDLELKNVLFDSNSTDIWTGAAFQVDLYENAYRPTFLFDSCVFSNNTSTAAGGAYNTYIYNSTLGPNIIIRNSDFSKNTAVGSGGAINFSAENALIENTVFSENFTSALNDPLLNGGGAISLGGTKLTLRNSIFLNNSSDYEGAALFVHSSSSADLENVLLFENWGINAIYSRDTLSLRNVTMMENTVALGLDTNSYSTIQNSIFSSLGENLDSRGNPIVISKGSNISSDNSMTGELTGHGLYIDMHNTDPKLNVDFVPENGSPAIDAANPDGVVSTVDLAGNPRIQGVGIDIGSYESFLVAVKDAVWDHHTLNVFPNPVNETLNITIESDMVGDFNLSIYNYTGQRVYQATENKSNHKQLFRENIHALSQGEYVVLVKNGQDTYATNIIIQR